MLIYDLFNLFSTNKLYYSVIKVFTVSEVWCLVSKSDIVMSTVISEPEKSLVRNVEFGPVAAGDS